MQRMTLTLALVLVLQLGLVGILWLGAGQAGDRAPEPLISLNQDAISSVRIAPGPDEAGVELKRANGSWQLPASDGFPAKQSKAESLAQNLAGIRAGLPVASSQGALARFDLEPKQVERRIVINEGESDSVTLLIGKSAGTNSVYARRAASNVVHEIDFASWQAEPNASAWFETAKLQVPITDVKAVKLAGFTLRKGDDGGWSLKGADPNGEVSTTKIREFVAKLVQPTFDAVSKGGAPEGEPSAGYTVVTQDNDFRFDYYSGDKPTVVRSGQDWHFQVAQEQLETVRAATPEQFVAGSGVKGSASAPGSGGSPSAGGNAGSSEP